jgi:hypothetical protein
MSGTTATARIARAAVAQSFLLLRRLPRGRLLASHAVLSARAMGWGWTQLTCVALVWAASLSNAKASTEVDSGEHEIGRRRFGNGQLRLVGDAAGVARLFFASVPGRERLVACDSLVGAWGLWLCRYCC